MKLRIIASIALSFFTLSTIAQEKSKCKFGKVSEEDFKQKVYSIDSNANAVVVADIGSTRFVGNTKDWFSLEYKRYTRIHILNKNGYDAANVEIGLYTSGNQEEELSSLKAVTYNLENGKVVETKLDVKDAVYKDVVNKKLVIKKFTFPNIKEGSIIEYQYEIKSDFIFNLQPWQFQGEYPRLWSEYNVSMPEFFYYITLTQGYQPYFISDHKDKIDNFMISDNTGTGATQRTSFTAGITDYRWVMKDIPALKEESYTSTINNHIARIEFQLAEYKYPLTPRLIMRSWPQAAADMLKDEDFGYTLNRNNGWLNDVMGDALHGATSDLDKAKNIFAYVRDNMTCTNYNRKYLEKPLKNTLKMRSGNEAEINLLLVSMLLKAGLSADPVMLSTRSHGYTYSLYPLMDRFNYIVAHVSVNGEHYFLDASLPMMGFGRLGSQAYNGQARIIDLYASQVDFIADSLLESKVSSVIIINDEKGNLTGSMTQTPGFYESYRLRGNIKEKGTSQFFSDIKKSFNADIDIVTPGIDSLGKYEEPVVVHYDFNIKTDKEDIIYLNPMFSEAWKENPFKSSTRNYPVEMPYTIDETYLLKLDVPAGYVIDELPKQIRVNLNDAGDGVFEYLVSESNGAISLRSRLMLKRAFYMPEEYDMLREFFNLVVSKHAEQIVFKKKKK
jgi:hypothetical protein